MQVMLIKFSNFCFNCCYLFDTNICNIKSKKFSDFLIYLKQVSKMLFSTICHGLSGYFQDILYNNI